MIIVTLELVEICVIPEDVCLIKVSQVPLRETIAIHGRSHYVDVHD